MLSLICMFSTIRAIRCGPGDKVRVVSRRPVTQPQAPGPQEIIMIHRLKHWMHREKVAPALLAVNAATWPLIVYILWVIW